MTQHCSMGVGCDEAGMCYAAAHGQPKRCPLLTKGDEEMKSLVLGCVQASATDSMTVSDAGGDELIITNHEDGMDNGEAKVYLNQERARELFNWLGLWLHKH